MLTYWRVRSAFNPWGRLVFKNLTGFETDYKFGFEYLRGQGVFSFRHSLEGGNPESVYRLCWSPLDAAYTGMPGKTPRLLKYLVSF